MNAIKDTLREVFPLPQDLIKEIYLFLIAQYRVEHKKKLSLCFLTITKQFAEHTVHWDGNRELYLRRKLDYWEHYPHSNIYNDFPITEPTLRALWDTVITWRDFPTSGIERIITAYDQENNPDFRKEIQVNGETVMILYFISAFIIRAYSRLSATKFNDEIKTFTDGREQQYLYDIEGIYQDVIDDNGRVIGKYYKIINYEPLKYL